jgi:hypothetical protein
LLEVADRADVDRTTDAVWTARDRSSMECRCLVVRTRDAVTRAAIIDDGDKRATVRYEP